jgi:hypothetical protein
MDARIRTKILFSLGMMSCFLLSKEELRFPRLFLREEEMGQAISTAFAGSELEKCDEFLPRAVGTTGPGQHSSISER